MGRSRSRSRDRYRDRSRDRGGGGGSYRDRSPPRRGGGGGGGGRDRDEACSLLVRNLSDRVDSRGTAHALRARSSSSSGLRAASHGAVQAAATLNGRQAAGVLGLTGRGPLCARRPA